MVLTGNAAELLTEVAERDPGRAGIVVVTGGDPWRGVRYETTTFGDLEERAARMTGALRRHGLKRGDRVVIFVPMSVELYLIMLAVVRAGAVAVFLDPWSSAETVAGCCEVADPSWFIGVPRAFGFLLRHPALRAIPHWVSTRTIPLFPGTSLEALLDEGGGDRAPAIRAPDHPAVVTFTTGSTGRPKGVDRTHGFLYAQHMAINHAFGYKPGDVDLPAFPIFMLNNLATGVTSVVPRMDFSKPAQADPAWITAQIRDLHVTTAVGSPAYFATVCRWAVSRERTCPSVRLAYTGGAPVPPRTLELMEKVFPNARVAVAYGSTEAEPICHISSREILQETAALTREGKGTCVGTPVDDATLALLEPVDGPLGVLATPLDQRMVPQGQVGEVLVSGPHVARSYFRDPESTARYKIRDSDGTVWHRTGDLGYCDADERLWLVGRLGHRILRAGAAVYPFQVEAVAEAVPGVEKAAAVGVDDDSLGQSVHVAIVPEGAGGWLIRAAARKADEALAVAVAAALKGRGFPVDGVHPVQKIPVDKRHNAKIDYAAVRQAVEELLAMEGGSSDGEPPGGDHA